MKKNSYKRPFCFMFSLEVFLCLASCSAILTGLPDEGEIKSIVEGGKSLVIMRLSASLSGKPTTSALS
ncbi:MAG: hypothetical protein Q8M56_14835 [Desulfobacterales bacterium]|nr:hypothetical protein [Desulfobacterales bacterium]